MKRVLFIPSWYPYSRLPHAGNFIINQANALAENKLVDISILNWGQLEFQLVLRSPGKSLSSFLNYQYSKPGITNWHNGVTEIRTPHLTWTHHILRGNIDRLIPKLCSLPKFDLIHAHVSYPAGYVAMKLSEQTGIPYIITEHSGPFPLPGLAKKGVALSLVTDPLRKAKACIAVSSALSDEIQLQTHIKSTVIPNLVNTDFFRPLESPQRNKSFSLFALSSLVLSKGIMDLVAAINILHSSGIDISLKIGGSGPLKRHLLRTITRYHLKHKIELLGHLSPSQALSQYQNCDCFVMPSHHESFSVVLLEAIACGKPVIATACGGPNDIVNRDNGLLIPPQNAEAMANAILNMMQSYRSYDPMFIRNHCIEYYSPKVIATKIAQVYGS